MERPVACFPFRPLAAVWYVEGVNANGSNLSLKRPRRHREEKKCAGRGFVSRTWRKIEKGGVVHCGMTPKYPLLCNSGYTQGTNTILQGWPVRSHDQEQTVVY